MLNAHLLHYKDKDNNWIAIPYGLLTMYDSYVKYCQDNNIVPVDQHTYYVAVGNLTTYTKKLNKLVASLGNTDSLTAIANALQNGVVPTTMGGTGVSYSEAELIRYFYVNYVDMAKQNTASSSSDELATQLQVKSEVDKINNRIVPIENAIAVGTDDPNTTPPADVNCKYYFQYKN